MAVTEIPAVTDEMFKAVKEAPDLGVFEAYKAHGFTSVNEILEEEVLDKQLLEVAVLKVIETTQVKDHLEMSGKARSKRNLTAAVLPDLAGNEVATWSSLSELERRIWNKVASTVWDLCKADPSGKIQKRLEANPKTQGMLLLRGKVFGNTEEGVFITDSLDLWLSFYAKPLKDKVQAASSKHAHALELAAERKPDEGKTFQKDVQQGMKTATQIALGIAANFASDPASTTED
jgi:hypothetical protein